MSTPREDLPELVEEMPEEQVLAAVTDLRAPGVLTVRSLLAARRGSGSPGSSQDLSERPSPGPNC